MRRATLPIVSLTLALALVALPALAYTVFMKDGTMVVAKEPMRIEGERVIITLPSGNETWIALDEVDVERTQTFNQENLGNAILLEGGEVRALPNERPAEQTTLRDLINSGQARQPTLRPEVRRRDPVEAAGPQNTAAGYLDLKTIQRQAYDDLEFMSELRSYFTSQGLEAQIFRGSQSDRPLVQVVTSSESSVFKSLQVASQAMAQMGDRHASRLRGMEILMQTARGTLAGQFVLTPELAGQINGGSVDLSAFYIDHVQF